ncbi:MAG: PqqD family protein [Ruminococcaceae bacterium]|nr:PqqD family protein [Oscillospiraceae bacterium]
MKLKYEYVINTVADQIVAVPLNCQNGKQNIIKTNETGAFILELLKNNIQKQQIIEKICAEYEIKSQDQLNLWVDSFIEKLQTAGVLCDE